MFSPMAFARQLRPLEADVTAARATLTAAMRIGARPTAAAARRSCERTHHDAVSS
jgi:hypothetical protein